MNNNNTNFSNQIPESNSPYSDLIYLFLDKEATQTEIDVLFMELSRNPILQKEFQEIASFYAVAGATANSYLPPADLAQSVFNAVGVQLAPSSVVANSLYSTIQNSLRSPLTSSLATIFSSGLAKSIALICMGAGMTIATNWIYNSALTKSTSKLQETVADNSSQLGSNNTKQKSIPTQPNLSNQQAPSYASESQQSTISQTDDGRHNTGSSTQSDGITLNNSIDNQGRQFQTRTQRYRQQNSNSANNSSYSNSNNIATHSNNSNGLNQSKQGLNSQLESSHTSQNDGSNNGGNNDNHNDNITPFIATTLTPSELQNLKSKVHNSMSERERAIDIEQYNPISVSRGLNAIVPNYIIIGSSIGLIQLPVSNLNSTVQPEGHCEILWSLSENVYVGVGGGNEHFPYNDIIVEPGKTTYIPRENMTYAGFTARYKSSLSSFEFLPSWMKEMEAQGAVMIGGSSIGLYSRFGGSLCYPVLPWLEVQLNTAISISAYNELTAIRGAQRINAGIGLGLKL